VQEVSLPSLEGYLGILPGHRPLVLALGEGSPWVREI
jgi:F0F1-type ATP synthase epsilon subunit